MPHWARLLCLSLLLVTLAGCGGSGGITQESQTERYAVRLNLDGTGFGERTATIDINDRSGSPIAVDQVVLAPVMREMGMAAPEVTAQAVASGRYQAKGQLFVMAGVWEVDVRISAGDTEEVASFKIEVPQP